MKLDKNGERIINLTRAEGGYYVVKKDYKCDSIFKQNPKIEGYYNFYDFMDDIILGKAVVSRKDHKNIDDIAKDIFENISLFDLKSDDRKDFEKIKRLLCVLISSKENFLIESLYSHRNDKSNVSFYNLLKEASTALISKYIEENWDLIFINEALKKLKIINPIEVKDTINELENITNSAKNFIVLRKEINNYIEEKGKIL